jgi:hypothetical protein
MIIWRSIIGIFRHRKRKKNNEEDVWRFSCQDILSVTMGVPLSWIGRFTLLRRIYDFMTLYVLVLENPGFIAQIYE